MKAWKQCEYSTHLLNGQGRESEEKNPFIMLISPLSNVKKRSHSTLSLHHFSDRLSCKKK